MQRQAVVFNNHEKDGAWTPIVNERSPDRFQYFFFTIAVLYRARISITGKFSIFIFIFMLI
jgi:hypothetical protein